MSGGSPLRPCEICIPCRHFTPQNDGVAKGHDDPHPHPLADGGELSKTTLHPDDAAKVVGATGVSGWVGSDKGNCTRKTAQEAPAGVGGGEILTEGQIEDIATVLENGYPTKGYATALRTHDAALRAEVERITDVAYSHCSRADAREADIERITAHYAGAMELANRKVSLMTELLRRAVPLVAFCAPEDSALVEDIRKAIHE